MTNLVVIATIMFSTNVVENLHPSGEEKTRTEIVLATVSVPGWTTNRVSVATNILKFKWTAIPVKTERRPLEIRDVPPMPPGMTNKP